MSLSAFARMRRSYLPVMEIEAERAEEAHKARWEAHHAKHRINNPKKKDREAYEKKLAKAEEAAAQLVGKKVEEGIKSGEEGGVIDLPLRKDHAAEIVGRASDQSEPKSLTERLHDRIPSGGTANEKLVEHMQVDQPGPPPELVRDALVESVPDEDKERVKKDFDARIAAGEAQRAEIASKRTPAQKQVKKAEAKAAVEAPLPPAGPPPQPSGSPGKTTKK